MAARLGWNAIEVYIENNTSAFKRHKVALPDGRQAMRVVRPEFRRMLDDLEARRIRGSSRMTSTGWSVTPVM